MSLVLVQELLDGSLPRVTGRTTSLHKENHSMSANFRADHVGSFLRPADLLEARHSAIPPNQLHALEDRHIDRVLQKQKDLGFAVFTDGEFRRSNFMSDFTDAVEGFNFGDAVARQWDEDRKQSSQQPATTAVSSVTGIVTARLRQRKPLTGHELPYLRAHAPGAIKITMPSATQFPAISFKYGITDPIYRDPFVLLEEITAIMVDEILNLASSGISYLQIDAPRYSYFLDPKWRRWMETELRVDPEADAHRVSARPITPALRPRASPVSPWPSTCAAATTAATGTPQAVTTPSPSASSTNSASTVSCSNMTTNDPAALRRSSMCRKAKPSFWAW